MGFLYTKSNYLQNCHISAAEGWNGATEPRTEDLRSCPSTSCLDIPTRGEGSLPTPLGGGLWSGWLCPVPKLTNSVPDLEL